MSHYLQSKLDRLTNLDFDEVRRGCEPKTKEDGDLYPRYAGALQFWVKEGTEVAQSLMKELLEAKRRIHALEWAAETVLNDSEVQARDDRAELYEDLYAAANAIEKAIKSGMTDDQLRKRLEHNLEDDELQHEQLIEKDQRCENCGEFCPAGVDNCSTCSDEPLNPRFIAAVNRAGEEEQEAHRRRGRN